MSPLHNACWKGQTEAVEFLLSNGAQIAESDTSLKTALHWTVQFEHFETLLNLLKVQHTSLIVLHLIQQLLVPVPVTLLLGGFKNPLNPRRSKCCPNFKLIGQSIAFLMFHYVISSLLYAMQVH